MTEQIDSKVPQIRFKGFEEEWEERMLGTICAIGDADHWMPETTSHGIPYVMTGDFCGINEIDFKNAKLISTVDFEKLSRKIKPELGDILFARYASIGSVRYINTSKKFIASYSCAILKSNKSFDSEYLFFLLQSDKSQNQLKQSINTGSQGNIGIESLKQLAILFPKTSEQTQIAEYFRELDRLIGLHQRKHDKLVTLKKAMLQKMFPQPGATTPEIRFNGFSGDWEKVKLGNVASLINGRAYSQEELLKSGKYKVLRVGNFYTNSSWYFSDMELADKYYAQTGDLLYTWSASFGPHIWNGERVIFHYHIWKIELTDRVHREFLLQLLENDKESILRNSNGSTMVHITKGGMELKEFVIPHVSEQQKIGHYFCTLDELITQHATQLQKLQQIKSACLEKMFV
jgi:type I restriction enzyme S subunit